MWQVYILNHPEIKERLFNRPKWEVFNKFCSFVVSNPSNIFRNSAFNSLSEYKKVSSYGKYLTNDGTLINFSKNRYWRDAKDEFFNLYPHKFSIAFENTVYPYYCTEKLMDAFLAGSLPIYLGDPKVGLDFNPKSFINAGKLGLGNAIELVKELDNNKDLFNSYYNEPVFTEEQKIKLNNNLKNIKIWLKEKI